jgi:hypothetical protein
MGSSLHMELREAKILETMVYGRDVQHDKSKHKTR